MGNTFKWRLTDTLFSYLTDENGGLPQITSEYPAVVENVISRQVAEHFSEKDAYATQFDIMANMIAENPETANVTLLHYTYYYGMDDNSCGFRIGDTGIRGLKGDKGDKGERGADGENGRGISGVTFNALDGNAGTRVTFLYTDNTESYFDIMNGRSGSYQPVDYNEILDNVVALGIPEQIMSSLESSMYENYQDYLNSIYSGALEDINGVRNNLTGITTDIGRLSYSISYESGQTNTLAQYYRANQQELITINKGLSAVSGVAYTNLSRVDVINSGVTRVGQEMNVMSGYIRNYAEQINIIDEETCAFTRDIAEIEQSTRAIKGTVEHISGQTRDLGVQIQTASSMTTTLEHQVSGQTIEASSLHQSYSSLTATVRDMSSCAVTYSQIEQTATAITFNVYSGLTRTGIDVEAGTITLNSNNLVCTNNDGETTMWIDENGNLGTIGNVISSLVTINSNTKLYGYFNTIYSTQSFNNLWNESDAYADVLSSSDTVDNQLVPFFRFVDKKGEKSLIASNVKSFLIPDVFKLTDTTIFKTPLSSTTNGNVDIKQILLPYVVPYLYLNREQGGLSRRVENVAKILRTPTTYSNSNQHLLTELEYNLLAGRELTFTVDNPNDASGVCFCLPNILFHEGVTDIYHRPLYTKDYYYTSGSTIINLSETPTVTFRYDRYLFGFKTIDIDTQESGFSMSVGVAPVLKVDASASICNDMYMFESGITQ